MKVIPMSMPTAPPRRAGSTTSPTKAWETEMIPAAKQPVRMRAATSSSRLGAAAHSTVPAHNPSTIARSRRRRPTRSAIAPHTGWRAP